MALVTADSVFSGITTFAKLPWVQCLGKDKEATFDIAFLGAPFVRPKPNTFSRNFSDRAHIRTPAPPIVLAPVSDQRASVQARVV